MGRSSSSSKKNKKHDDNHDMEDIGRGLWYSLHILSCYIFTREEGNKRIASILLLLYSITCSECSSHIMEYLSKNPIENTIDDYDRNYGFLGLAKYMWGFHNIVNIRKGRQIMNWDSFMDMYFINKSVSCNNNK